LSPAVCSDGTKDEVASGELVRVLQNYSPRFPGFYLYYPSRKQMPKKLKAFIDFYQEILKSKRRSS
jgi:DNA-binding transcriptional LysR family regulator